MRILLIKLSAIGDVVQALPVLAALRRLYPRAFLGWVVGEAAAGLLVGHPLLDQVLVFPRRRLIELAVRPGRWPQLFVEGSRFFDALRAESYDVVIDLQGLLKSGVITGASRGRIKLGFAGGRELSSLFLTERLPPYDPDEHAVSRYLRLAAHLGADVRGPEFPIAAGPRERAELSSLLGAAGVGDRPLACINPGTAWESKRWTARGFAAVADHCRERWGMLPVVVGGPADRRLAGDIAAAARSQLLDFTGRTGLGALALLYRQAGVVVSVDTGPMHLAAAAGAKVVALFGPTAPWRTGPFGAGHIVVRSELSCSPCFRRRCAEPVCMRRIEPGRVCEAVDAVLGRSLSKEEIPTFMERNER